MLPIDRPLLCIGGPTASGKSGLAIYIAQKWKTDIISVDSSQVYQHFNIGTAKVTPEEMQGITHHLIDYISPNEPFNAGLFCQEAKRLITVLNEQNKPIILCGGTALYFQSLLFGLCEAPKVPQEIDQSLRNEVLAGQVEALHAQLSQVDPIAAQKIMPRDQARIVRALGVYLAHGVPLSQLQKQHDKTIRYPFLMYGIDHPRDLLNQRIETRVDQMFADGLIHEVEALKEQGYTTALQSMSAIGYRLTLQVINGELPFEEARQKMIFATRQYARRQYRFFNRQLPIQWLSPPVDKERLMETLIQHWGTPP